MPQLSLQSIITFLLMHLLLFLIITGTGTYINESIQYEDQTHSTITNPPPFTSPSFDTPTILNGSEVVNTSGDAISLGWRLFFPNISEFQPGNFWISFDVNSNTTDGFEDVVIELINPDNPKEPGGIHYGAGFVWSAIVREGVFIQYTGFRNRTYFFMNDTAPSLTYPKVGNSMLFRVKVIGFGYTVYLFNTTIQAETLFPILEVLEPALEETDSGLIGLMNNETRTVMVNASDPSGLEYAALYGLFENLSTSKQELFLFDINKNIESDTPFELAISIDLLLEYTRLTNQTGESLITIDTVLEVSDIYGIATYAFFQVAFTLKNATTENTPLFRLNLDNLPLLGLSMIGVVIFSMVLIWKSRRYVVRGHSMNTAVISKPYVSH